MKNKDKLLNALTSSGLQCKGINDDDLKIFLSACGDLGVTLSFDHIDVLKIINGAPLGGGLAGTHYIKLGCSGIPKILYDTEWLLNNRIVPVAADGCGNYFGYLDRNDLAEYEYGLINYYESSQFIERGHVNVQRSPVVASNVTIFAAMWIESFAAPISPRFAEIFLNRSSLENYDPELIRLKNDYNINILAVEGGGSRWPEIKLD